MGGGSLHGLLRWDSNSIGALLPAPALLHHPKLLRVLLPLGSLVTAMALGAAMAALVDDLLFASVAPTPPVATPPAPPPVVAAPVLLPFVEGRSFAAEAADERASRVLPHIPSLLLLPENRDVAPDFLALHDALAREIASYRRQVGGMEVALAVTDLQTGETISVNGDAVQRSGCTVMTFALLAVVAEFEQGRAAPTDVADAIRAGIGDSSPPHVHWFLQELFGDQRRGVAQASSLMWRWGMRQSRFDHVPYYGDGTLDNLLTAREMNFVLAQLYAGELFSPEWTAYTLERLREIKPTLNYILPGQLPAAATAAHKIGYLLDTDGHVNNDAGIVTFRGGDGTARAYAITYLSQRAATEPAGIVLGARLSRQVWDYFAAKYAVT